MRILSLLLLTVMLGSLTGCYSFKGAREDVGFTGPMVEDTWTPCCNP